MEKWTPEQINIQKERDVETNKLVKNGAEWVNQEEGIKLEITEGQYIETHQMMEYDEYKKREKKRDDDRRIEGEIRAKTRKMEPAEVMALNSELEKNADLIPVEKVGIGISILRFKKLPGVGFPLQQEARAGTRGKIIFYIPEEKLPSGFAESESFSVVCACCSPELKDVENPFFGQEGSLDWKEGQKVKFREAMQAACSENGITTLIVRHAELWEKVYGRLAGVNVIEAQNLHMYEYGNGIWKDIRSVNKNQKGLPMLEFND